MKLRPLNKINDNSKTASKHFEDDAMQENYDIVVNFLNLEQLRSRISDAWSIILTFSLTTTFCLRKSEKRTKKT